MKALIDDIKKLKNSEVKRIVDSKIMEMRRVGDGTADDVFKELCFCILTANYNAKGGMKIQQSIGDGFLTLPEPKLAKRLKELGHRYPNARAGYIAEARMHRDSIKGKDREWLVHNVKGLGYKEASHFLRNTGSNDHAIIDFHIVDLLVKHGLVERPKAMTKKKYLEIESILRKLAEKCGMSLGELDFYLWYMETGKILK